MNRTIKQATVKSLPLREPRSASNASRRLHGGRRLPGFDAYGIASSRGVEAVVERKQRMAPEGDDDRLVPMEKTVGYGSLGPVRQSSVKVRFFHLATVAGLIPWRLASTFKLSGLGLV